MEQYKNMSEARVQILPLFVAAVMLLASAEGAADLPSPDLTPGAAFNVTKRQICTPGYASSVRKVSATTKRVVFQSYGLAGNHTAYCDDDDKLGCEADHLISLELGGSNDIANLWPEPYGGTVWNAHVKDKLENRLHALVCRGEVSLQDAQREIATDWIASYRQRFGEP
jgi:hypothetical protein